MHVTQPQSKDEDQLDWAERVVLGVLKTAERDISVFASISPIAASKPLRTSSEKIGSTGPAVVRVMSMVCAFKSRPSVVGEESQNDLIELTCILSRCG